MVMLRELCTSSTLLEVGSFPSLSLYSDGLVKVLIKLAEVSGGDSDQYLPLPLERD